MNRRVELTPLEQITLIEAAYILERIPAEQAWQFSLCGDDGDCVGLKDQAKNLREMVGYADGSIQYDFPIGPAQSPIHVANAIGEIFISSLRNQIETIHAINASFELEFNSKKVGDTINVSQPERFRP